MEQKKKVLFTATVDLGKGLQASIEINVLEK